VQGSNLRGNGISSLALGSPQVTRRSETWQSTEEATSWPASIRRTPQETEGTDPGQWWVPEEVGCRPQEDDPHGAPVTVVRDTARAML
jgi:hypothetical protein